MEQHNIDRIIEMAWEDRSPFEAIKMQFDYSEADVIALIRELKRSSLIFWRKRVNSGISQNTLKNEIPTSIALNASRQKSILMNKISKR